MLAKKDIKTHILRCSVLGLANHARVTVEQCEEALKTFQEPDPYSSSLEFEGRKVKRLEDGSWLILNGERYARMLSREERREYHRIKQAEYRERKREAAAARAVLDPPANCDEAREAELKGAPAL